MWQYEDGISQPESQDLPCRAPCVSTRLAAHAKKGTKRSQRAQECTQSLAVSWVPAHSHHGGGDIDQCEAVSPAMENLEVLVRGMVVQNAAGLQQGAVIFRGTELLWVLAVATIVLAVVSVTRVSVVSVGWTWGSKPGHVRVRVQSAFLARSPGAMFSAEILDCSADSCSEDASSPADRGQERAAMVFIFDESGASLVTRATTAATVTDQPRDPPSPRAAPDEIVDRTQPKAQEIQEHEEAPLASSAQLIESAISLPRREGIGRGFTSPTNSLSESSSSGVGRAKPLAPSSPSFLRAVRTRSASPCEWDPLLRLRLRDAVLRDGGSGNLTAPLAPVAAPGSSSAATTLKDGVVRVWNTDSNSLLKCRVRLPAEGDAAATAFGVNWEPKLVAMARKGGAIVSVANLERFQTQQPVVHAIHIAARASLSRNLFTEGPASAHPGCGVSIYDCRSSTRPQLCLHLPTAPTVYGLRCHDHSLYLRDRWNSLAEHDVRMLKPYPVNAQTLVPLPSPPNPDAWWDTFDHMIIPQGDVEDDAPNCKLMPCRGRIKA